MVDVFKAYSSNLYFCFCLNIAKKFCLLYLNLSFLSSLHITGWSGSVNVIQGKEKTGFLVNPQNGPLFREVSCQTSLTAICSLGEFLCYFHHFSGLKTTCTHITKQLSNSKMFFWPSYILLAWSTLEIFHLSFLLPLPIYFSVVHSLSQS